MNKNFYRIVFNKARGMLMVVAENAASHSSNAGNTTSRRVVSSSTMQWLPLPVPLKLTRLQTISLLMSAVLFYSSDISAAQILADNTAPTNQQPVILSTGNGLPLVNIQTPNSAGVSVNQYSQFNVGSNGVVLNNSGQGAITQLAGSVSGNPYIVTPASIILNQVNSSNPSLLQGYIEVAGQRAQVIVANPSGITCSGCGFINASGVTLTTGVAQLSGTGSLEGYRVTTGTINIDGLGMDGTKADYTDLISRAVVVNAGIWAQQLNVEVGANQVVLDPASKNITSTAPITAGGPAPQFAIDVAALGGMYANQISLVGTEAGVGVRNAGKIGSSTGSITISSDGQLQNSGQIGSGSVQITSPNGLTNTGTIAAAQALNITTPSTINNSGTLEAGQLQLSTGNLVNQSGTIEQTGSETLTLVTSGLSNQKGTIGIPVSSSISGTTGTTGTSSTGTTAGGTTSGTGSTTSTGSTSSGSASTFSPGSITVGQSTQNQSGTITASGLVTLNVSGQLDNTGGNINVQSAAITGPQLTNNQGMLAAQQLKINTGTLLNQQGHIFSAQALPLTASSVDNTNGHIQSADALNLSVSNGLINEGGVIGSNGDLTLTAGNLDNKLGQIGTLGNLNATINGASANQQGQLLATKNLAITAAGDLDNTSGLISGQTIAINLQGNTLHNSSGEITSTQGDMKLQVGLLDNGTTTDGGKIASANDLVVGSSSLNNAGEIYAQGNNTFSVGQMLSNTGYIAAQGNTAISAEDLTSTSSSTLAAGVLPSGQLVSGQGTLTVNVIDALVAQGINLAGNAISMQAGDHIDLSKSQTLAPNISLQVIPSSSNPSSNASATTGTLNLKGALVVGQALTLVTPGQLTTDNAQIGTGSLNLTAASWSNEGGQVVQSGNGKLSVSLSGTFDNSNGGNLNIASNSFSLQAAQINNQLGEIDLTSQGTLTLQTPVLLNQQGKILSNGTLNLQVGQATLDGGKVAGQIVQISGGSLSNQGGLVEQSGTTAPLQLNLTGDLNNQNGGVITSAGGFNIQAQDINNEQGAIQSTSLQTPSTLTLSGNLDNSNQGQISTLVTIPASTSGASIAQTTGGSDLTIQATTINNEQGVLSSGGQLNITANQLDNSLKGMLSAQSDLTANTQTLNNQQGQIQSALGNITLNVAADVLNNNQGQIQSTQGITINSQGLTNVGTGSLIKANTVQINTNGQTLDNTNGQIVGASTVNLNTGHLINIVGLIQGGQDVQINTNGQDIDNYAASVTTNSVTTYPVGCHGDACVPLTTTAISGTFAPTTPMGILSNGTLELNQVGILNNANQTNTQNPDNSTSTVTQSGQIASNGAMNINASLVFNEMGGSITSGGAMTITAGEIDNTSVAGNAGYVDTQGLSPGQSQSVIASQGDMVLNTGSLDNGLGIVAAVKGNLTIQNDQGTYINNTTGQIQAGKDLSILAQVANLSPSAQIYNFYGGVISGNNVTIQNAGIQGEYNSQIYSAGSMTLNIAGVIQLYSNSGIQSGGNLTLDANGNHVYVDGPNNVVIGAMPISGSSFSGISSQGTINLQNIDDLSIFNAAILSNGAAQISTNTLEMNAGDISSGDSLKVNAANSIFNVDFANIIAVNDVTITTGTLDNGSGSTGGNIQSNNGNVNITTTQGALTNDYSANIAAAKNINLNTQGLSNLDGSNIQAGNNIQIENNQQTLTNANSQIAAGQNIAINTGSLINNSDAGTSAFQLYLRYQGVSPLTQNALIQAGGNLSINTNGQSLTNQNVVNHNSLSGLLAGGTLTLSQISNLTSSQNIQSTQAMSIQADSLTNSGNVLSGDTLTIAPTTPSGVGNAAGVSNAGNIQSLNALQITASQITNLQGATLNSQAAGINLQATAGDLNSSGTISSAADTVLAASGNLTNKGLIQTAGNLTINTSNTFLNEGSSNGVSKVTGVLAQGVINITAGDVSNLSSSIQSGSDILINAQTLENSYISTDFAASSLYAQGNLNIQLSGALQNLGFLAAGGNTTITAGSVNSSGGIGESQSILGAGILPNGNLTTSGSGGVLQITAPTIFANGRNIASNSITLSGGDIDVSYGFLSAPVITLTANNSNYAGTQGNLNLTATQVANSNQLNLTASNQLTTDKAQITVPVISLSAASWSNQGGFVIQNSSDPTFQVNLSGILNNKGGTIETGANNLTVSASSINNAGGTIANSGTGTLSINTSALSGKGGTIESNGVLQLTTTGALTLDQGTTMAQGIVINAGSLSNQGGLISQAGSGQSLQINDQGDLSNQTGRILSNGGLSVNAQNIINTGGKLAAGTQLNIQANSLTGDGIILSQGNANLQLTQDLTLASGGEIETNGTLNLSTAGNIDNAGQLLGQTGITLTTANLTNESSGTIAGDTTQLKINGTLNNLGLINGSQTQINANTVNNMGNGQIFGDVVSIAAQTLNNTPQNGTAPVIGARLDMELGVGTLNNNPNNINPASGATIISLGSLNIGGSLDSNRNATGTAQQVNNYSGTIQALGNLSLNTTTLNNQNNFFTVGYQTVTGAPFDFWIMNSTYDCELPSCGSSVNVNIQGIQLQTDQLFIPAGASAWSASSPLWHDWNDSSDGNLSFITTTYNGVTYSAGNFTHYTGNQSISMPYVVQSDPGQITAGGNLQINTGSLTNNASQIIAGNTLQVNGSGNNTTNTGSGIAYQNTGTTYNETITDIGTSINYWPATGRSGHDGTLTTTSSYTPAATTQSVNLSIAQVNPSGSAGNAYQSTPITQSASGTTVDVSGDNSYAQSGIFNAQGNSTVKNQTAQSLQQENINAALIPVVDSAITQADNSALIQSVGQFAETSLQSLSGNTTAQSITAKGQSVNGQQQGQSVNLNGATASTVKQTMPLSVTLPQSGLYTINSSPTTSYVVDTNSNFISTGTQSSLSNASQLLQSLQNISNTNDVLIGDAFYQQQLVQQQVEELTGQLYLNNYSDTNSEYQALLTNGATFAQQQNLTPGVALTAAQMADLTSDIVWLVNQTVTLPNGTTETVLVPQVYLAANTPAVNPDGSVIGGKSIVLTLNGNLSNGGSIVGQNVVSITGNNLTNLGTISGNNIKLNANGDITDTGGTISAGSNLVLEATGNIDLTSTQDSSTNGNNSQTSLDRVAALSVGGGIAAPDGTTGNLILLANNINLTGATINNQSQNGLTELLAQNSINLNALTNQLTLDQITNSSNYSNLSITTDAGSSITGAGSVTLDAGGIIAGIAAQINAANNLTFNGGSGIALQAGSNTAQFDSSHVINSSGFFGGSTTHDTTTDNGSNVVASNLTAGGTLDLASSAGDINLQSVNLQGSTINLSALQGTINLLAAYNTDQSSMTSVTKVSGLGQAVSWTGPLETMIAGSNGNGQGMNVSQTGQATTLTAGTGGINIQAQGNINSQGTDLTSGGDITISSSQGQVILGAVNNLLEQASSNSSSNPWLVSSSMSSTTSQTSQLSQMQYAGNLVVKAAQGIQIGIPVDQGASTQNIQTLVTQLASQPGMSWLANMQASGQIDYNQIQQIYQHQSSSSTSLGVASDLVIAIAVTIATAGAGGPAAGAAMAASDAATAAGASASVVAAAGAAASAAVVSTAIAATDATINSGLNGQGLSGIVNRLDNKATVDSILTSMLTAGVTAGIDNALDFTPTTLSADQLTTSSGMFKQLGINVVNGVAAATVNQVINGGNLGQNLTQAGLDAVGNTVGAVGFNEGASTYSDTLERSIAHGLTGALTGYIIGGNGQSALAGGVSGLTVGLLEPTLQNIATNANGQINVNLLNGLMQATGAMSAAAATGNSNMASLGQTIGGLAYNYNWALHPTQLSSLISLCAQNATSGCATVNSIANASALPIVPSAGSYFSASDVYQLVDNDGNIVAYKVIDNQGNTTFYSSNQYNDIANCTNYCTQIIANAGSQTLSQSLANIAAESGQTTSSVSTTSTVSNSSANATGTNNSEAANTTNVIQPSNTNPDIPPSVTPAINPMSGSDAAQQAALNIPIVPLTGYDLNGNPLNDIPDVINVTGINLLKTLENGVIGTVGAASVGAAALTGNPTALGDGFEDLNQNLLQSLIGNPIELETMIGGAIDNLAMSRSLLQRAETGPVINETDSALRISNGVILDPRLPDPVAGLDYQPTVLDNANPNIANSHVNGYVAELQLANEVAALPGQVVVKYGDAIGTNGSDVISVDASSGDVTLWDSKYRSGSTSIQTSPTFTNQSTLMNAQQEAINAINESTNLSQSVKDTAIQNINSGTFTMNTVGAGNAKNSVTISFCNGKICGS